MLMIVLTYNRIIIKHPLCAGGLFSETFANLGCFGDFLRTFYGPKYDLLKIKYGGVTKLINYIKYGNKCNEERGMSYLTIF